MRVPAGPAGKGEVLGEEPGEEERDVFFLQKVDGRFYPDFLCKLEDGRILVVEYKGQNGWTNGKDDREIGGLWEELGGGKRLFVMVTDKDWKPITEEVG